MTEQNTSTQQQTSTTEQQVANTSYQSVPSSVTYPQSSDSNIPQAVGGYSTNDPEIQRYISYGYTPEQATSMVVSMRSGTQGTGTPTTTVTNPVGITSTETGNVRVYATDKNVQNLISQGLSTDAAIAAEVDRINKQAKQTYNVISSSPAIQQAQEDLKYLKSLSPVSTTTTGIAAPSARSTSADPLLAGLSEENRAIYDAWVTQLDADNKKMYELLDQQRSSLAQANQQAIDDIKNAFVKITDDMKRFNASRIKGQEILGNLSGRQRYAPTEHMNIMSQEEMEGMQRLADIAKQEQSMINQAKRAAQEEDWKLLYETLNMQKQASKEKIGILQTLWEKTRSDEDRAIKLAQQERQIKKDALDDLALFTSVGGNLDPQKSKEYDRILGFGDGFTENYIQASRQAAMAKSTQDYIESLGKMYDMLSKVPFGEVIQMPDGSKLYGRKGADGIFEITQTYGNQQYKAFLRMNPDTMRPEIIGEPIFLGEKIESMPSSYKEWELAGGSAGTGKTYGEWILNKGANVGDLSDKDLAVLDRTTEKKALEKLADLKVAIQKYKSLIDTYGFELYGENAATLDSAYATAKVLWKEAANLGALTGPDVKLIEEAIKPVSGLSGVISKIKYGLDGVKKSIDDSLRTIDENAKRNYELLLKRNSRYLDSEYVKALGEPFVGNKDNVKYNSLEDILNNGNVRDIELFESLRYDPIIKGLSEKEVLDVFNEYIQSFNKPLSMGEKGSLDSFKRSIVIQESGGKYNAIGADTKYGNALGKYQIIPMFHFSKIGLKDTPEDRKKFLNSPQLQDKLFDIIISDLHKQYGGDYRKIAAAYYGGSGAVQKLGTKAADVPQGNHPSINQYVSSVLSRV